MKDMQEFIKTAAGQLGVGDDAVQNATASILDLVKKEAGQGDYDKLVSAIPGADKLAGATGGGIGGMLGGIGKSLLGDKFGGGGDLMAMIGKSGLDLSQAGKLGSMFFNFAKEKAGGDLIEQILGKMPDVKKLLG